VGPRARKCAAPALLALLDDPDPNVRAAARSSLARVNPAALSAHDAGHPRAGRRGRSPGPGSMRGPCPGAPRRAPLARAPTAPGCWGEALAGRAGCRRLAPGHSGAPRAGRPHGLTSRTGRLKEDPSPPALPPGGGTREEEKAPRPPTGGKGRERRP